MTYWDIDESKLYLLFDLLLTMWWLPMILKWNVHPPCITLKWAVLQYPGFYAAILVKFSGCYGLILFYMFWPSVGADIRNKKAFIYPTLGKFMKQLTIAFLLLLQQHSIFSFWCTDGPFNSPLSFLRQQAAKTQAHSGKKN